MVSVVGAATAPPVPPTRRRHRRRRRHLTVKSARRRVPTDGAAQLLPRVANRVVARADQPADPARVDQLGLGRQPRQVPLPAGSHQRPSEPAPEVAPGRTAGSVDALHGRHHRHDQPAHVVVGQASNVQLGDVHDPGSLAAALIARRALRAASSSCALRSADDDDGRRPAAASARVARSSRASDARAEGDVDAAANDRASSTAVTAAADPHTPSTASSRSTAATSSECAGCSAAPGGSAPFRRDLAARCRHAVEQNRLLGRTASYGEAQWSQGRRVMSCLSRLIRNAVSVRREKLD